MMSPSMRTAAVVASPGREQPQGAALDAPTTSVRCDPAAKGRHVAVRPEPGDGTQHLVSGRVRHGEWRPGAIPPHRLGVRDEAPGLVRTERMGKRDPARDVRILVGVQDGGCVVRAPRPEL